MTAPDGLPAVARVLALAADPTTTITDIRITAPLAPLQAAGRIGLRLVAWHDCHREDLARCDLLIAQRPVTARHLRLMQAAHESGAAVIVEIDDLLTRPAPHLLSRAMLERQAPWVERALEEADFVSVSTARLAAALAGPAAPSPRFRTVPNHAWPTAQAQALARHATAGNDEAQTACVLLAASEAVAAGPAFEALRRLQARRGHRLRIVAVGPVAASAAAAGLEVEGHPVMPRERFLALAADLPCALGVIPIDDSAFSACKSAVKWFDYAALGLPTVMSDRPPYRDVVEHGQTGWLVADDAAAWEQTLAQALDDAGLRQRVATRAREVVLERHSLAQCTAAWLALIDEALAARAAGRIRQRRAQWHARWLAPWHDLLLRLRRANRQRLERRRQRPGD